VIKICKIKIHIMIAITFGGAVIVGKPLTEVSSQSQCQNGTTCYPSWGQLKPLRSGINQLHQYMH